MLTSSLGLGLAGLAGAVPAPPRGYTLPPTEAESEPKPAPPAEPWEPSRRIGFAVVGLGNLTCNQLLPAFAQSGKARLVALVSGHPEKARLLAQRHGVSEKAIYDYKTFDRIVDNPEIQAVYIVLPNSMHLEFTVRAARAGKHVLCEKPMANTVAEAEEMIRACKEARRKLMIAYRIQYEPGNRMVRQMLQGGKLGAVRCIEAVNVQNQGAPDQWRHKLKLAGGGALPDIGLYNLNTTRFLLGEEPSEVLGQVFSRPGDPRFTEVEETCQFQMNFPSGVRTSHVTNYSAYNSKRYRVYAEHGWIGMDPAFAYQGLAMEVARNVDGQDVRSRPPVPAKNQFIAEIDHMAACIAADKTPYTPGEEGLQDQKIMAAIYESARLGRAVKLDAPAGKDLFRGTDPDALSS